MSPVEQFGKIPSPQSVLSVIDEGAQATMRDAQAAVAPIVTDETPRSSGTLAGKLAPKVTRTATGRALTLGAARGARESRGARLNDVMRWVQRGTGIYREGPGPKHRITAKNPLTPMLLPNGRHPVRSVAGQRPNPFMGRIRSRAQPRVESAIEAGSDRTAEKLRRLV